MKTVIKPTSYIFRTSPLWSRLNKKDMEEMSEHTVETPYSKGTYLLEDGVSSRVSFLLKSGILKCVKGSKEGRVVTLKLIMPGDPFCNQTFPGSVVAMTDVVVLEIARPRMERIMNDNPDMAMQLILFLANRLREAQEITTAHVLYPAKYRLACLLRDIAQRAIQAQLSKPITHQGRDSLHLNLPLTRQELADLAGLTLPTTSKLMKQFQQEDLIIGTGKHMIITDLKRLEALTESFNQPINKLAGIHPA